MVPKPTTHSYAVYRQPEREIDEIRRFRVFEVTWITYFPRHEHRPW